MYNTSVGFHTIMLSLPLTQNERKHLISHFQKYSSETNSIMIYSDNNSNTRIRYFKRDMGIDWTIYRNNWNREFNPYILYVKINPKILGGIYDYITAASLADLNIAITNYNNEAKKISYILKTFDQYTLKRIDYCINFDLTDFTCKCTPEQMLALIRRSNIPANYTEWSEYDPISHRKKSKPESFYLVNPSVTINCYSKYMQLQNKNHENAEKGYDPIPQWILDASYNIIRFEIQCKHPKTYSLSAISEQLGDTKTNKYKTLLSKNVCLDIIDKYYRKTIGMGDWYTLQEAIQKVKSECFNIQHENRLIAALQLINQKRNIPKAKEQLSNNELAQFKMTLKELSDLGINPVTIPRPWGISRIPNLLHTYYYLAQENNMRQYELLLSKKNELPVAPLVPFIYTDNFAFS